MVPKEKEGRRVRVLGRAGPRGPNLLAGKHGTVVSSSVDKQMRKKLCVFVDLRGPMWFFENDVEPV